MALREPKRPMSAKPKSNFSHYKQQSSPQSSTDLPNQIAALQSTIGNFEVQRLLASQSTGNVIQRHLNLQGVDLQGKKERTGVGALIKNSSTLSTFSAIKQLLSEYKQKEDSESITARRQMLLNLRAKCDAWLNDKEHQGKKDDQKRESLRRLVQEILRENKRLNIIEGLGVPEQTADTFDEATLNAFDTVAAAFHEGNVARAFAMFQGVKPRLGASGDLIEAFMKRNQIARIDPTLGNIMNNPQHSEKDNQQAIGLMKAEAQKKIDRFNTLQTQFAAAQQAYQAEMKKPQAQRPQVDPNTLPPDKKSIYDAGQANDSQVDPLMLLTYPILHSGTAEGKEFGKLRIEIGHYQALVSGKAVQDKKQQVPGLTDTELYGLIGYTSNLYGAINTPLRKHVGTPQMTHGHKALAGSIASGLNKMKRFEGQVYRHGGEFSGYAEANVLGATVSDMAPLSTAIKQGGAASGGEQHEVLEVIQSQNGRDVSSLSLFGSGEGEVLFAPGARFRVTAVFVRNGADRDKKYHIDQWRIRNQQDMSNFAQAMTLLQNDSKKDTIRRIVFKTEVK